MNALQNPFALLARLLLAALFLPAGISKISGFAGTAGYIGSVGLPLPELGAAIAIAVEVLGGIALIIGFGTRWAALALAVFTLVASFFFHAYWAMPAEQQMMQRSVVCWHWPHSVPVHSAWTPAAMPETHRIPPFLQPAPDSPRALFLKAIS